MLGGGPELVRHRIQFTEIETASHRVTAIEPERTPLRQKPASQGTLQPVQAFQRLDPGGIRHPHPSRRPAGFDLPYPFDNHGIVCPVGTAVERKAETYGRAIVCGKQQSVAAKVIEAEPAFTQTV